MRKSGFPTSINYLNYEAQIKAEEGINLNKKIILMAIIILLSINSIAYQYYGFYNNTELYLNTTDFSKLTYYDNGKETEIPIDTEKTFKDHLAFDLSEINEETFYLYWVNNGWVSISLSQFLNTNSIKNNYRYNVSCKDGKITKFTVCGGPLNEFLRYDDGPYCLKYFIDSYSYTSDKNDGQNYYNDVYNDICITKQITDKQISCNEKIKLEFDYNDGENFYTISTSSLKRPILSKISPDDVKIEKIDNKVKITIPKEYNGLIGKIIFQDTHGNKYEIDSPSFNNNYLIVDLCGNKIDKSQFDISFWNEETYTIFEKSNINLGECSNDDNNEKSLKINEAKIFHDSKYHLNVSWTSDCENFDVSYLNGEQWEKMCKIDGGADGKNGFSCELTKNGDNYNVSVSKDDDDLNYINKVKVSCDSMSDVQDVQRPNDNDNNNNQNNAAIKLEINGMTIDNGGTAFCSIHGTGGAKPINFNITGISQNEDYKIKLDSWDVTEGCKKNDGKLICDIEQTPNEGRIKLRIIENADQVAEFTLVTDGGHGNGLTPKDEYIKIGNQIFHNNDEICLDKNDNTKMYFVTLPDSYVGINGPGGRESVQSDDNENGVIEIPKDILKDGRNIVNIVTIYDNSHQTTFYVTIYYSSDIIIIYPKDNENVMRETNFKVCGGSDNKFDINVNVTKDEYQKVGEISSNSKYVPAEGMIDFGTYTGKRKIKVSTSTKEKTITLNIVSSNGGCNNEIHTIGCGYSNCECDNPISNNPDKVSTECSNVPTITLKMCQSGTLEPAGYVGGKETYKLTCNKWIKPNIGYIEFTAGSGILYEVKCPNGECKTYMHFCPKGKTITAHVGAGPFNDIYILGEDDKSLCSLNGANDYCASCDIDISGYGYYDKIRDSSKLYDIITSLRPIGDNFNYYTYNYALFFAPCTEPYEGKRMINVFVSWVNKKYTRCPQSKSYYGLLIWWRHNSDGTCTPYVKKCENTEYCSGYKETYLNYDVHGTKIGILMISNVYKTDPRGNYKKNGEINCDFECKNKKPSTPQIYSEGYGSTIGSSVDILQNRDFRLGLKINGMNQPSYRLVVWVLNITKDGNPVDAIATYIAPSWSGTANFPNTIRLSTPGTYKVKSKIYYSTTGQFNYDMLSGNIYTGDHKTEVCDTTQPVWYFLKNIDKVDDFNSPWKYTLLNFITKTTTFYGDGQFPMCRKYCMGGDCKIVETIGSSENIKYNIKSEDTNPGEFTVNVKPLPVWVNMYVNDGTEPVTIKNGENVNLKFIIHNLTKERLNQLFLYVVEQYPSKIGLSENNPLFYDGLEIPEGPMKYEVDIQSCNLDTLKCTWKPIHVRKCNQDELNGDENPDNCYVFTEKYGSILNPDPHKNINKPLLSICKNDDGTYDQDCIKKCSNSGDDMKYCPHTLWGSILYYGDDSPLIAKDHFSTIATNPNYIEVYVKPEDFVPTPCNARIESYEIANHNVEFGDKANVSLKISGNEGCYYYVVCDYVNNTNSETFEKTPYSVGQFDENGETETNVSATMDKSGLWNVKSCTLYSSEDGYYHTPNMLADSVNDIGRFEVSSPEITDGRIDGPDKINVGREKLYKGYAFYKKDGVEYKLENENIYYNWTLKNCNGAQIIGRKEGTGVKSIMIKGIFKGTCTVEVNMTLNGKSIKVDKSITINPSDIGYNGDKKEILLTPSKSQIHLTNDRINVVAKISGYRPEDKTNKLITFSVTGGKFDNGIQSCYTDNYGKCNISIIPNGEDDITINAYATVKNDRLTGSTTVYLIKEGNEIDFVPLIHGWNLIGKIGSIKIENCDYDAFTYDQNGKYVKNNKFDIGNIYWIYVKDNSCKLYFSGDLNDVEHRINDQYKYASFVTIKSLSDINGVSAAFEFDNTENKWVSVQKLFPGKAYLFEITQ